MEEEWVVIWGWLGLFICFTGMVRLFLDSYECIR